MDLRFLLFAVSAGIFILDRVTKWYVRTHFSAFDTHAVIPGFFNIVHTENPGIAFGLLANSSSLVREVLLIGFSVLVLVGISIVLLRPTQGAAQSWILRIGLALVLGGALGNLYDRIVTGTVTDFFEVHAYEHYFPVFNVADSAISAGAGLLLLDMWRTRERKSETAAVSR